MPIVKRKQETNYTVISNALLQQEKISFEAKGILCELLSRPENWYVRKAQFLRNGYGRDRINRVFKELKELGYLEMSTQRGDNGQIADHIWTVYDTPHTNSTCIRENLHQADLNSGKTATTKERYIQSKDNNKINIGGLKNSVPVEEKSIPKISANITNTNPEPIGSNIIAKGDKIPQEFIDFWKSYKGWKLGMKQAWELFKTHRDYQDCLGLLCPAVKSKIKSDLYLSSINQFTPQWKHLKNWIKDRCWEEVPPLPPKGDTGYEPEFEAIQDLFGDYDQEG